MAAVDVLGRVDELASSVDAVTGAAIGPYREAWLELQWPGVTWPHSPLDSQRRRPFGLGWPERFLAQAVRRAALDLGEPAAEKRER